MFLRAVSDNALNDILITALEGGSNYWYLLKDEACDILSQYRLDNDGCKRCPSERMLPAIIAGEKIPIHDCEDPDHILGEVSLESLKIGINKMIADKRTEVDLFFNEDADYDANDADVIFQYIVMGEIVFG
jgi:hypothetical protein